MNTQDIISAIIRSEHGWAVAEQFEVTWDNRSVESIEQQNSNAMDYIMDTVNDLINYSEVFNEDTIDELQQYVDNIKEAYDEINAEDEDEALYYLELLMENANMTMQVVDEDSDKIEFRVGKAQ